MRAKRPTLGESVAKRVTQRDLIDELQDGRRPTRRQGGAGLTFTASFTIPPSVDNVIHTMAVKSNVSRSEIVRSAVLRYAYDNGYLGIDNCEEQE